VHRQAGYRGARTLLLLRVVVAVVAGDRLVLVPREDLEDALLGLAVSFFLLDLLEVELGILRPALGHPPKDA